MRTVVIGFCALLLFSFAGRSAASQSTEGKKKAPKVITLSGCVQRDENAPEQYVINDAQEGLYRLSGKNFSEYIGRRVTVDGGVIVKGLSIKGGLTPNANIAAQAGALDPSRAAVQAATQPAGTSNVDSNLPEFRVKKIATSGTCEPQ